MGPPDRRRAGLAYAEIAHPALAHEITHCPDRVRDRHGRNDTMDVIKVDDIGFEPLQTALAARLDEAMPKSPSPQLVKTAEELRLDEARENGVPWKQWGRHGDCRPVSSIDVNN